MAVVRVFRPALLRQEKLDGLQQVIGQVVHPAHVRLAQGPGDGRFIQRFRQRTMQYGMQMVQQQRHTSVGDVVGRTHEFFQRPPALFGQRPQNSQQGRSLHNLKFDRQE